MPQRPQYNPFTDEHYQLADTVCKSCAIAREYLNNLVRCGFDVAAEQAKNEQQYKQASSIKQVFFPDLP